MLKTELEAQNERLRNNVKKYEEMDIHFRQKFKQALEMGKLDKSLYGQRVEVTPDWEDIFVEVGRLRGMLSYTDKDTLIKELREHISKMEHEMNKKIIDSL